MPDVANVQANEIASAQLAPPFWRAALSEEENLNAVQEQLRAARISFGNFPLLKLGRGTSPFLVPGKPPSAMNKAIEVENLTMQQEVARLSTQGSWRTIHDSTVCTASA